ncbi:Uncharacterized protein Fot_34969 [Forsythia ovata]|uniref:Uncharacterized protein n=1 Tax=Forsythia ovata TaxID=205694 RepID=A0ABD1SKV0_9LAMI
MTVMKDELELAALSQSSFLHEHFSVIILYSSEFMRSLGYVLPIPHVIIGEQGNIWIAINIGISGLKKKKAELKANLNGDRQTVKNAVECSPQEISVLGGNREANKKWGRRRSDA